MSLMPSLGGGHYDEQGSWVQTKHCLVSCGERCDCQPPFGVYRRIAVAAAPAELPKVCPWDSWKPERTAG